MPDGIDGRNPGFSLARHAELPVGRVGDWGHRTIAASDADEAIKQVEAGTRPDFALVDILLGAGPDGIALASALRERWDILSIFVSGNLQGEHLDKAIRTGPLHILKKPFTEMDLQRMLAYAKDTLMAELCEPNPESIWRKPNRCVSR